MRHAKHRRLNTESWFNKSKQKKLYSHLKISDSLGTGGYKTVRALLENYYIDSYSSKNTDWFILCLLHELRVVTFQQLHRLINLEYALSLKTLRRHIMNLRKLELVGFIVDDIDKKSHCYYLTKNGHNTIGGVYSFPKVPEYNLKHHLMVTNAMIETFSIVGNNPNLLLVQSERRQVYEIKDQNRERKGKVFSVADFLFRFETKSKHEANWYFEIELTMKTRRRYRQSIFPKYIGALQKNKDARLLYVTPSQSIEKELLKFKKFFLNSEGAEKEELFQRLHIIPSKNFSFELEKILACDPYINW